MLTFLKRNIFISIVFLLTLGVSFLTFLTFINKSFIFLSNINLNYLLLSNICLLLLFFFIIFIEVKNSIKNNISVRGSIANRKYIIFFSLFTLIPSLLISIFSLFLFSFALEKYFDNKITLAVNNSYKLARDYVDQKRNKIESDIVLVSYDLGKSIKSLSNNKDALQNFLNTQRILRGLDQLYLLDLNKNIILSSPANINIQIEDKAFNMVQNDNRPLKIINAFENKSAAIIKVQDTKDLFLYVVKFLDKNISNYLKESEEALNFYYTVEDQRTGIRISFALIYIIIVTLLLFLSITIAIRFSSRFFISINNLISASSEIGKGNLDTKVPEVKADIEMERLNKNFNAMVEKLKSQQEKLLNSERHEAWENVARKLAHEIKNPLTPIQLTIDNLKSKYSNEIGESNREKYNLHLKTILKQIKQIETLVNEFSDFARMPKPLLKKNNIIEVVKNNIEILKNISKDITINFNLNNQKSLFCMFDNEQISRVFFNLIKNSIESIKEKSIKSTNFDKIINIEIIERKDYININLSDTGTGFLKNNAKQLIKPYFTTKEKGSGLGLSIVNKIINDHDGIIQFMNSKFGAKVVIKLPK